MTRETAILIPHYNNLKGLERTIESLEGSDSVDLVIVDDGSDEDSKPSEEGIKIYLNKLNCKLHLIFLKNNKGVENALNTGINFILRKLKSKFIFRVDSGDICVNKRLDKQIGFLNENPEICLVGSWVKYINERSKDLFVLKLPTKHQKIEKRMYVRVPFIHSAVLFRASALNQVGLYSTDYKAAEDYAFFMKFVKVCKTANIPEVLTEVEWNPSGISPSKRKTQLKNRFKLLIDNRELSFYFIYGILRVLILMILPYRLVEAVKKKVY